MWLPALGIVLFGENNKQQRHGDTCRFLMVLGVRFYELG